MRVHSPDAYGATWEHQRIQACAESHIYIYVYIYIYIIYNGFI